MGKEHGWTELPKGRPRIPPWIIYNFVFTTISLSVFMRYAQWVLNLVDVAMHVDNEMSQCVLTILCIRVVLAVDNYNNYNN